MREWIVQLIQGFPPQLAVLLLSALPVTEMRVAIPLALTSFHLSPFQTIFLCLLGNMLPIPILLTALPAVIRILETHGPAWSKNFVAGYLASVQKRHTDRFEKIGAASLGLVALLPLPGAGIWTGCLLAVLFQIRPRHSVPSLVAGAAAEAVIIFLIAQGTLGAFRWLL